MKSPQTDFAAIKALLAARSARRVDDPGLLETAVSLILAPGTRGTEVLFIRRAERADDPWSGHIALPGGRREESDADRLATAVRETREEVGVELTAAALLGPLDDLHPSTPRLPALVIRPFVFGLAARPETRLSDEVSGVIWLPLADLAAGRGRAVVERSGAAAEVECFAAGGLVIWGLTYRILAGFLPLLDDSSSPR